MQKNVMKTCCCVKSSQRGLASRHSQRSRTLFKEKILHSPRYIVASRPAFVVGNRQARKLTNMPAVAPQMK